LFIGRVVSVNAGLIRDLLWNDRSVSTGIFKEPVTGRVRVHTLGLEGDRQADLIAHGGPEKALYAYPSEHYEFWKKELGRTLAWGMFGENLTTQGLLEDTVRLEDEYRVGSATVVVTRPRFPCYKLGIKFETMEMVKWFEAGGRSGFYLSVKQEGDVGVGDKIELISSDKSKPRISEVFMERVEQDSERGKGS
jgi:MOSC domain-containing protein YiiM